MDSILLAAVPVTTCAAGTVLTNASGFLFERDEQLFLITSRHVLHDPPNGHRPDAVRLTIHTDPDNLASAEDVVVPLYEGDLPAWRQAEDGAGTVDVAALRLERALIPSAATFRAFTPAHLYDPDETFEVGSPLLVIGFPLGFHDTLHNVPVARHAILASAFGLRFQGQGYFLTDARTHRGASGAPVVLRDRRATAEGTLPWRLLGVHSARIDAARDLARDEALGLNSAWYADVIRTLTDPRPEAPPDRSPD